MRTLRRHAPTLALLALTGVAPALAPPALRAQPAAAAAQAAPLTLGDALALARARSPLVRAAAARRAATAARARQDAVWPNPLAEWRYESVGSAAPRDEFFTVIAPVDVAGRRLAFRGAARAADVRAAADSAAAVRDLELAVARAYWRAALAGELAALAVEQGEALGTLADFDAARLREGAVAENAALRTRVEADRAALAAAAADAERERALGDLARTLALPVDSLPALAPLAFPAAAPPADSAAADALRAALAFRPELRALRAGVDEARRRRDAEGRGALGDVQVTGGTRLTAGVRTGVLAVGVPLPVANRNEPARERAAAELALAEAELADGEQRVRAEAVAAVRALARLRAAGAMAGAAGGALAAALDARAADVAQIARAAYREGGSSLLEVLEAQRARADARAAALRWAVEVRLAQLDLLRATGAPIDPGVTP